LIGGSTYVGMAYGIAKLVIVVVGYILTHDVTLLSDSQSQ